MEDGRQPPLESTGSDANRETPLRVMVFGLSHLVHTERFVRLALAVGLDVQLAAEDDPIGSSENHYQFLRYKPINFNRIRNVPLLRSIQDFLNIRRVRKLILAHAPDLINVQWVDERAFFCAKANIKPLVLSCFGTDVNRFFKGNVAVASRGKDRIAFALRSSALVTADCTTVLERVSKLAEKQVRSQLFFYGIDFSEFERDRSIEALQLRNLLGIPSDSRVILSCRRVAPNMGQQELLKAFAMLCNKRRGNHLSLVFKLSECDGTLRDYLVRSANEFGIGDRVFWIDESPHSQVPVHYALSDVVVSYPKLDATPVSFLEASAARKPLISSDLPNYRATFKDAFLFVSHGDIDLLSKTLADAIDEKREERNSRLQLAFQIAKGIGDRNANGALIRDAFLKVVSDSQV